MVEPPKTQAVPFRSLGFSLLCTTVPANDRTSCRWPSGPCLGPWNTQCLPWLHRVRHLLWLLTCHSGRGSRQESRDLVFKKQLCPKLVAWHRTSYALSSWVSSVVIWGGWTLDNGKVLSAVTFYESASSITCSYFDHFLEVIAIGFWTNLYARKAVDGTLQWYWSDCLCHCPDYFQGLRV